MQYNGRSANNADYQQGYQDGINSGRADANGNKRFNLESHPYYTNSNDQAYREGFAQGYREAYGQDRGITDATATTVTQRADDNGYPNGEYNTATTRSIGEACRTE